MADTTPSKDLSKTLESMCTYPILLSASLIANCYDALPSPSKDVRVILLPNSPYGVISKTFSQAYGYLGFQFMELGFSPEDFLSRLPGKTKKIVLKSNRKSLAINISSQNNR